MLVTCLDTVNVMNGIKNVGVNIAIVIQTGKKSTEGIEGIGEASLISLPFLFFKECIMNGTKLR